MDTTGREVDMQSTRAEHSKKLEKHGNNAGQEASIVVRLADAKVFSNMHMLLKFLQKLEEETEPEVRAQMATVVETLEWKIAATVEDMDEEAIPVLNKRFQGCPYKFVKGDGINMLKKACASTACEDAGSKPVPGE